MCGCITATFEFSDIRVRWNLDRDLPKYTPRFNVAPETSPNIPVIVRQRGGNECRLMHWGLIPHWAADPSIGNRMINARAETLTELPSYGLRWNLRGSWWMNAWLHDGIEWRTKLQRSCFFGLRCWFLGSIFLADLRSWLPLIFPLRTMYKTRETGTYTGTAHHT